MRILHLSMLYPPHIIGGAERSVAMLSEATTALGHQVAAACISPTGEPATDRNGVTVYRMPHETDYWPEEWPKHSVPARFISKFKQQFNVKLERHFDAVIEDFKPDIVHTHSMVDVSTLLWRSAKRHGKPLVHTLRDYDVMCSNSTLFNHGHRCEQVHAKCQVLTFRKKAHHQYVDAVAGVGTEILERHVEMGYFGHVPPHLRRVIWNAALVEGAGPSYQLPSREGKPFTFGYLGRIDIDKGVGTVLDACRRLAPGGWEVKIAGRAATGLEPFERMATDMPVEFVGFQPPKEFFESIDVLIVPSIWAEPLPRTILESYAVGVPVIGSDSGGIPELIGSEKTDWLFAPGNDAELAERMMAIMAKGRDALPRRPSFEHVLSETTPQMVAERYLAFYDDVIAQAKA
jgi:glycosyltransferase involved in cell wall biosynthesis